MQALVLVGGEGTRLRPLTLTTPKPALTLVDRPFIAHMLGWLARHGVTEVVMATGFRAADLRAAIGDSPAGLEIAYLEEPEPLGTAGPIRLAADEGLLRDRFLALNGDVLTDLDLSALIAEHERAGARASLGLYPVDDPSSYGLVRRSADGAVTEFLEKPDPDEIDTDEVNAGCYVLEREVAELIPPGRQVSIEREVFPRLVGDGLSGARLTGYWKDMGTPERYLEASWDILSGAVETGLDPGEAGAPVIGEGAEVDAEARLEQLTYVAASSRVAAAARLGPRAVLARGAVLEAGAELEGSVALEGAAVGRDAVVRGAILAERVSVGAGARVEPGAVVGAGAVIEPGARVEPGARIEPQAVRG